METVSLSLFEIFVMYLIYTLIKVFYLFLFVSCRWSKSANSLVHLLLNSMVYHVDSMSFFQPFKRGLFGYGCLFFTIYGNSPLMSLFMRRVLSSQFWFMFCVLNGCIFFCILNGCIFFGILNGCIWYCVERFVPLIWYLYYFWDLKMLIIFISTDNHCFNIFF